MFRSMFDRLVSLLRGSSSDYAPISPIEFVERSSFKFFRLRRFARGTSKVYASISPMLLLRRWRDMLVIMMRLRSG